jgi:predicted HTH transcriptional regulator
MKLHELHTLIEAGEGLTVEFKRKVSTPGKIAREMIALANTRGGVLLFGVDDDGAIVGVESEKSEIADIDQAADFLADPPVAHRIEIVSTRGMDVIAVHVPESRIKPHYLVENDERTAYVRVGENSVHASREMVRLLRQQAADAPLTVAIGEAEKRLFTWFDSRERITVGEYAKLINVSERRASRLLIRLVRAGALAIHTRETHDYFTLMQPR